MEKISKNIELLLHKKYEEYNVQRFIADDPISVPHRFLQKQDIEIAAFFAAIFAWGNRKTIINKCNELMMLMDNNPYDFILHHAEKELKNFVHFKHRTFNADDIFYFISFLHHHYKKYSSLEDAFCIVEKNMESRLIAFRNYFFSLEHLSRTRKHISTPQKNAACKRINLFLKWMVRKDESNVDFGIWKKIASSELIIPLDVHVARVSKKLNLLEDEKSNWKNAVLLTQKLKQLDENDPVKFDFALFGMGVYENKI